MRLDLAYDADTQRFQRLRRAQEMGDVAKRILVRVKPRINGDVDAPIDDVLAFVIARRKPQKLRDRGRGRVEMPDDAVGNTKAHDRRQATEDGRRMIADTLSICPLSSPLWSHKILLRNSGTQLIIVLNEF